MTEKECINQIAAALVELFRIHWKDMLGYTKIAKALMQAVRQAADKFNGRKRKHFFNIALLTNNLMNDCADIFVEDLHSMITEQAIKKAQERKEN